MAGKEAFCLLLWIHQGGQVDARGRRVASQEVAASGYCDEPTDCYRCPLMQLEISRHPPGHANWVCPACLTEVSKKAKSQEKSIFMTQHYSEGQCQYVGCTRPPRLEYRDADPFSDGDKPWTEEDLIERPRGYSRLLQLVIGDINT